MFSFLFVRIVFIRALCLLNSLRNRNPIWFLVVFSISGDGYARAAWYNSGTWNLLGSDWIPSDAIHQGAATNVLELEARGTTFVFSVNGTQVLQVEDAELAKGDIGLYAGAFNEADVVVDFDNLEVQPLQTE